MSKKILVSTNRAKNYQPLGSVEISSLKEITQKVSLAQKAKENWKELGVGQRIKCLSPLLEKFYQRREELALLITRETGKPIKVSRGDLDFDWGYFKWFLDNGERFLADEITYQDDKVIHKIVYEPIGVAAVIVPWNFPFSNFFWGVIPNLIAGNPVVFKHSEECPLTGKLIEEVMKEADLPEGVFSEVYGNGKVGEILVNQDINLIWFTGSSLVGKKLYELAGKKYLKTVLEMGGSNPGIVFEDANTEQIIDKLYDARFFNCGQVCDALKRLIVHEAIFEEVVQKLKKYIETKKVGDPEDKNTDVGSLVAERQLELLKSQVADAVKKGARVVIGGKSPENLKGAYYLPTILINIKRDMRVWKEEVFGPVLPVISFRTEEEAIELANDTPYGLGASLFTSDRKRALRIASKIQAGSVEINGVSRWLPCNPFGGYKDSGVGREHGRVGFQELCQIKVITNETN